MPYPVGVRLDRRLAAELGVPRSRLTALVGREVNLRGPIRGGASVALGVPTQVPERAGQGADVEIPDLGSTIRHDGLTANTRGEET